MIKKYLKECFSDGMAECVMQRKYYFSGFKPDTGNYFDLIAIGKKLSYVLERVWRGIFSRCGNKVIQAENGNKRSEF